MDGPPRPISAPVLLAEARAEVGQERQRGLVQQWVVTQPRGGAGPDAVAEHAP